MGDSVYKIIEHGKQGSLSMDPTKLIKGFYEVDGESIIIENDMVEYKKYFVAGKAVDWIEYKKIRPEDRINYDKLDEIKKDAAKSATKNPLFTSSNKMLKPAGY